MIDAKQEIYAVSFAVQVAENLHNVGNAARRSVICPVALPGLDPSSCVLQAPCFNPFYCSYICCSNFNYELL